MWSVCLLPSKLGNWWSMYKCNIVDIMIFSMTQLQLHVNYNQLIPCPVFAKLIIQKADFPHLRLQ